MPDQTPMTDDELAAYRRAVTEERPLRLDLVSKALTELDRLRAENAKLTTQLYNRRQCAVRELEAQVRGDEAEEQRDALAAKLDAVRSENTILAMQVIAARDCVTTALRAVEDDLPRTIEALDMAAQALGPVEPSEDLRRRWESATTPPAPESSRPPAEEEEPDEM